MVVHPSSREAKSPIVLIIQKYIFKKIFLKSKVGSKQIRPHLVDAPGTL